MRKRAGSRTERGRASRGRRVGGGDAFPRFEVYVIDSGWKTPAAEVVRNAMPLFAKYMGRHEVYVLSTDHSEKFLQGHPQLLGKDPIIAVLDREAIRRESADGVGVRLLLGRIRDEHRVLALLKMLLRIVNTPELAADLPGSIRRYVHREGVAGAVEIVMSAAGHVETESGH
ncbi:MAG TPA: hypothetical protein VMS64_03750 [Candidatus Methylomirabilis sp.]|nr:hypothetical protein [Candidatus Methylomirabilis sp.]